MKRDFDLIRQILREVESSPARTPLAGRPNYEGFDEATAVEHIDLLLEAGLLQGKITPFLDGGVHVNIQRLTWKGHDFLDAMKDDSIWEQAKESILKPVGGVAFDVLLQWLKWKMSEKLGLPGSD